MPGGCRFPETGVPLTRPSGFGLGGGAALAGGVSNLACDGSIACKPDVPAAIAVSGAQYDDTKSATTASFIKRLLILIDKIGR